MQGYNLIAVYNHDKSCILMCKRRKNPYKGLSNLVGGKIEPGEKGEDAAYRELCEETSITPDDIELTHFMDFTYHLHGIYFEVYAGKLNRELSVKGDENELYWSELNCDFYDCNLYAGEGNLGYIISQIKLNEDKLLAD